MTVGKAGKICVFRLLENDDLIESIEKKAQESNIRAGVFILIGSIKHAVLGYYRDGEYKNTKLEGPLEVASCTGNVAVGDKGEIVVHAHIIVTNEKCEAFGGHLMKDSPVGATAELIIIEATGMSMARAFDEKTKLRLLRLG
jgi:predicted DNA-binding protein with PD1-like motif